MTDKIDLWCKLYNKKRSVSIVFILLILFSIYRIFRSSRENLCRRIPHFGIYHREEQAQMLFRTREGAEELNFFSSKFYLHKISNQYR